MAFSGMEWVIVGVIVVVLFFGGAKVFPRLATNIGRARGEFDRGRLQVDRELRQMEATGTPAHGCRACGRALGVGEAFCPACGTARLPWPA